MSENTPPAFGLLDKFPTEIRSMIFGHMIQDTIQQARPHEWKYDLVLDISQLKSHLNNSPWITLNKQYCAEYLRVFLKQVELRADITRRERGGPVNKKTEMIQLEGCLMTIARRFKDPSSQVDFEESNQDFGCYMKGVCL
jgi:hypothetical protein